MMSGLKSAMLNYEEVGEPHERRRAARHTTVFQVAKLCTARSEELCILRDISDTGLRAEIYCHVEPGEPVVLEMRTGHRLNGTVVWNREPSIGVQFDAPISVPEVLAHCSFDDRIGRMRPPRIDVTMPGLVLSGRQLIDVEICNISQAGMKITTAEPLLAGSDVTVRLAGIGQRGAKVRWFREGQAGLQLLQALTYAEFAAWRVECLAEAARG
ncbi:PilZ domain-containing protein [Sphingomonas sp. AP4-R1]|uniref:PilZ domain-containing protein n=1 Tax=Sphingomonas sp. AP4-R1 TaxID=2735134 RepID=UPI001493D0BB|nr:PilZ domain-containing protein [Sphingomonas sp. AP4-R1]QJU58924.1 PilZ domain-containing protein [Sphingomonas sp. AP4-R1]